MHQSNNPSNRSKSKGPSNQHGEKIIHIETCRDCKHHSSTTWHDEAKYKKMFLEVKAAIESTVPGSQVLEKQDRLVNLGAFEIMHEEKILYSKKVSGLWPNPKAVAQRVQQYFDDLFAGRDVSSYRPGPERAYVPPKKKIDPYSRSGMYSMMSTGTKTTQRGQDTPQAQELKSPQNEEEEVNHHEDHEDHQEKDNGQQHQHEEHHHHQKVEDDEPVHNQRPREPDHSEGRPSRKKMTKAQETEDDDHEPGHKKTDHHHREEDDALHHKETHEDDHHKSRSKGDVEHEENKKATPQKSRPRPETEHEEKVETDHHNKSEKKLTHEDAEHTRNSEKKLTHNDSEKPRQSEKKLTKDTEHDRSQDGIKETEQSKNRTPRDRYKDANDDEEKSPNKDHKSKEDLQVDGDEEYVEDF